MSNANTTFASLTTKKARIEFVREKLGTDKKWALRGLSRIYANQTEDEKRADTVTESNGIGFTGIDGEFLSSLAKQFERTGDLSEKQMVFVYKKMPKYAKQLVESISTKPLEEVKVKEEVEAENAVYAVFQSVRTVEGPYWSELISLHADKSAALGECRLQQEKILPEDSHWNEFFVSEVSVQSGITAEQKAEHETVIRVKEAIGKAKKGSIDENHLLYKYPDVYNIISSEQSGLL